MAKSTSVIGILGGTFDPIHYGHLRIALECLQAFSLDQVRFIPCHIPPHRHPPIASGEQRLAMVQLAIDKQPQFVVDDIEFHLPEPSYMHTTLTQLRKTHTPDTALCLILGMDAFQHFHTWFRYEEILDLAHIIVVTRPQQTLPTLPVLQQLLATRKIRHPQDFQHQPAGLLAVLPVTQLDIAARQIRQDVKSGVSARYLCPDAVLRYIEVHGLYSV